MGRLVAVLLILVLLGAAALVAVVVTDVGTGQANPADCRSGDVLEGVHHPSRLAVIDRCVTARGTVAVIENHGDGDWHMGLLPDPGDLDLIGRANVTKLGGLLVAEVIPMDQDKVKRPSVGSRIEVTGAYVIDTPYGWREIHPVWTIRELNPSPLPQGVRERAQNFLVRASRVVLRVRAQVKELINGPGGSVTGPVDEED